MLARRIIPCLDIDKGRVVKGVNFLNLRDAGDAIKNAQFYEQQGADELVFLDITASHECRKTTIDLVKKVAEVVFMPFTVGGGIRNPEDIRKILLAGADKVSLNTAAVKNPRIIFQASRIFGSQCIVVAIDAKERGTKNVGRRTKNNLSYIPAQRTSHVARPTQAWEVYINGGRTPTGIDAIAWARNVERLGAGEILLTSMDYDGTKDGYDIELTRVITEAVKIPVIASGGAGHPEHFYEIFKKTNATAALAASIFHFREFSVMQIKKDLAKNGVQIRM